MAVTGGADGLVREPLYQQMNERLRELLRGDEFQPGDQFLTERLIAERFGVSRPTANKVLSGMVSEGLLEFRKGVGTFVRGPRLDYDLRELVSFTRKATQSGMRPLTQVIRFEKIVADEAEIPVAKLLRVNETEPLYYMERLRLADKRPVIYERRWTPVSLCPGIQRRELQGSIYSIWTGKYGLTIAGAEQVIRAVNIRSASAKMLGVRLGTAGFLVSATGLLSGGRPLWHEQTLYRGDAYEFHLSRPAPGRLLSLRDKVGA